MKKPLPYLILGFSLLLQSAKAQETSSPQVHTVLQNAKPAAVPQAQWDKFTASISFTCEQWGAEIGFLTPFLVEKEILALVKEMAGRATAEVFVGYKSLADREGCKMNDRFVCVIKECEALDAR
ncbi:MAG: hypothetical protein Q8J69_03515 [Sphingobacteriaceae bacterium]|nr:hypothetical protein [Sphingobacteriaceae bacterium]